MAQDCGACTGTVWSESTAKIEKQGSNWWSWTDITLAGSQTEYTSMIVACVSPEDRLQWRFVKVHPVGIFTLRQYTYADSDVRCRSLRNSYMIRSHACLGRLYVCGPDLRARVAVSSPVEWAISSGLRARKSGLFLKKVLLYHATL